MSIITASELTSFAKDAVVARWGYVYGGQGQRYTPELAQKWAAQERAGKSADYFLNDCARWFGRIVVDCSGLLVEAFRSKDKNYYDRTANTFRAQAVDRGAIHTIPQLPGLGVWRRGHIGLYVGNSRVIEAAGTRKGVIETTLGNTGTGKPWTEWLQLRDVDYDRVPIPAEPDECAFVLKRLLKLRTPYMRGDDVREVQDALMARRYDIGGTGADGIYGPNTTRGVKRFQRDKGLVVDGIVGPITARALGGIWAG